VLRRLLLLPMLLPLLAVLLVAGLNPRPLLSLRLLTWRSPPLPLGAWIALAAGGGAALTTAGSALALAGPARPLRRRLHRDPHGSSFGWAESGGFAAADEPARRDTPRDGARHRSPASWREPSAGRTDAGPSRAPGEPAPTVEVPFRVIRRGNPAATAPRPEPVATAAAPGQALEDDWDSPASDTW
jgi:hypothetical protein